VLDTFLFYCLAEIAYNRIMHKMLKKYLKDEYIFLFLGALIVAVGVFGYSKYSFQQLAQEDVVDTFEESIPAQCENSVWIEFPEMKNANQFEKFVGRDKLKYEESTDAFSGINGGRIFSTDNNYSLSFFMDRDVQMEGYVLKNGEIYVKKVKCVGIETNKDVLQSRRNLMGYVRDNINTLAPEKPASGDWQVETFYFVNDTDVYVQYETEGSFMEEAPYDSHLWLIRASKLETATPTIETLAYIAEDAEDAQKNVLKSGQDIYSDVKNMTIYEFDADANQWILQ
jgi:hypothetical protein